MGTEKPAVGGAVPPLVVRTRGSDRTLPAGSSYLVGRDPECDIALTDARVSWHHAVLQAEDGRWVLEDSGSTNGTFAGDRRVDRIEIDGECLVRLGHPLDGPVLSCTVSDIGPDAAGPHTRGEIGPADPDGAGSWPIQAVAPPASAPSPEPVPPASEPSVAPPPAWTLRIGRAPDNDLVVTHAPVSWHHAELRNEAGACRIVDLGSSNGTFVNGEPVTDAVLSEGDIVSFGSSAFRLAGHELQQVVGTSAPAGAAPAPATASPGESEGTLEIPYAVRWLVPNGERFANFDILNDNDTQLDYYRRFGHIYAVGIPAKKWRLVVVSDPELLDEVAADEEQFGKRVEEINFFTQLSNTRGGGISVIGDGPHYEQVRRVMLPWYAPLNQRTQLGQMKDQARKLVAAWSAIPDDEPLDARAWMERYTLEVSGRGACNYDFGLLDGSGDPHPFAVAVPESTKESIRRVADPRPDSPLLAGPAQRA
ncbi:MAG TPA: cytochrome P450, partial [Streptosporangiaceae bacterium]|nr:cytochrome P450 [Streptosporangiaceae bacterium]